MKVETVKENEDGSANVDIQYTPEELHVIVEAGTICLMSAYLCEMTVPQFVAEAMIFHRKKFKGEDDADKEADQSTEEA